jgi:hypothetical protein
MVQTESCAEVTDDQNDASAVLWEQSKAEIAQQDADVDSLRTRAVALLSVGALVGGLFGSRLPHGHLSPMNVAALVVALVLFAASVVLAVAIAWPRNWYFGADREPLVSRVADGKATLAQVNLSLAQRAEQNWTENYSTMRRMYGLFALLCAAAGLQVVAWAIAVI